MVNKKDFLKYASKLAFPIMIQNLIGTLVYIAGTVMLGYSPPSASSGRTTTGGSRKKRTHRNESREETVWGLGITKS